jgi:voltage-gated potassium channel
MATSTASPAPSALQRRVYGLLDGRPDAGDPLDIACYVVLLALIVGAIVLLIVGTVPAIEARWGAALRAVDVVLGVVFLVEYALRVWAAPADPRYRDGWRGRLRFVRSPLAVLDLVAVVALLLPHLPIDLRQARLIRLFALLRVGKVGRFVQSMSIARRIFRARRDDLLLAVGAVAFVLLVGSTLMYFAERDAQPEKFGSIPDALWWGVATITTVGYGDVYPVTALGRALGGLLAVLGIASFALPTAILGAAFLDELQRARAADVHARCPTCGQPWHDKSGTPH